MTAKPLSERERRFVEAYMLAPDNNTAAAKAAGYKGNGAALAVQANRLLKRANVQAAMQSRAEAQSAPTISDRKERHEFLTQVHRGAVEGASMRDRLKAVELLAKSQGEWTTEPPASAPSLQVNILASLPVDALRAMIQAAKP